MITKLALIALNTLLCLALVEGGAHIAERWHPEQQELSFRYAPYRMLRMDRAPWPLNRAGFRAEELDSYRGKFLVEFLGGSVCLGVGTNPGLTVPERLERLLHAAGMKDAAVLNLCQGGAPTGQEMAIFLHYGLPLAPQAVLSFNGANDLMHPAPLGDDLAANLPYRNREIAARMDGHPWVEHLALFRVAQRVARRAPPVPFAALPQVSRSAIFDSYFYANGVVRTLAESQGAFYALILQPTLHFEKPWSAEETSMWKARRPSDGERMSAYARELYGAASAALDGWARETGATSYDLTRVFSGISETVYSDSVHFTGPRGYERLTEDLAARGLVEQLAARYKIWESQRGKARERSSVWRP